MNHGILLDPATEREIKKNGYKLRVVQKHTGSKYLKAQISTDGGRSYTSLGRWLLGVTDPKLTVDHENRDALDNRLKNLRLATHSENNANNNRPPSKCGYKGVEKTPGGRFIARIGAHNATYLGIYDTPVEAARAYDGAARERWGSFARTNFPPVES